MTAIARFLQRYALWVVLFWILIAVGATLVAPQLQRIVAGQDEPFLPRDTPYSVAVQRSAEVFATAPSDNVADVVLERYSALTDSDRAYYDRLVEALRGDTRHVINVVDWWSSPLTAAAAVSDDQRVVTVRVLLSGPIGTLQAGESIAATRAATAALGAPEGLHVYVTGPGAAMVDMFSAMDGQEMLILEIAAGVAFLLLLIAYRSPITALVPTVSVGLALTAASAAVAFLGSHHILGVSRLATALGAVMIVGAGTGYTIVQLGPYLERRKRGLDPATALIETYRKVAPTIAGSALTLSVVLSCVSVSRISLFRDTGVPCAVGLLTVALAALTLTPALVALAERANLLRQPPDRYARRWHRIGVIVARWPSRALIASAIFMFVVAIPLRGLQFEWDQGAAAPANSESARGYQVVDRHFPPNHLLPDIITVEVNQDIRNANGLLEVEQITGAVMNIPSVARVQSASRLDGSLPTEATMTVPAGPLGDRLEDISVNLASQPQTLDDMATSLDDMVSALDSAQDGLQQGLPGLGQVSAAAVKMQAAATKLRVATKNFSDAFAQLPAAVAEIPRCLDNPVCFAVQGVVQWARTVADTSVKLAEGVAELANGILATSHAMGSAGPTVDFGTAIAKVQQARAAVDSLRQLVNSNGTSIRDFPGYLHNLALMCRGTPGMGLNAAIKALTDPATGHVLDDFLAPGGHAARLFVYGTGDYWTARGAARMDAYLSAVQGATKDGKIRATAIEFTGVGPAIADLQLLEGREVLLLGVVTLLMILAVAGLLLRSPIAALVVFAVVVATYLSTLGASITIWQYLLGYKLHWLVLPTSFLVLLTASSGYTLQLALRVREELPAGQRIAVIRALTATGSTLTTAGTIVGATMFALVASTAMSLQQIGVTVGVGALLNTLVVRRYALPAVLVLLGNWFWWPRPITEIRRLPGQLTSSTPGRG